MSATVTIFDDYFDYAAKFETDSGYVRIRTWSEQDFITSVLSLVRSGSKVRVVIQDGLSYGKLLAALYKRNCDVSVSRA